ncbi:MAG: protein kinase domain-containing protein [Pseudonocardiaceae bacterium]
MTDAQGQQADSGDVFPELPGYRIERQLGRGSMGVVYLAEDVQLRRNVALKILAPTLADDELFRKRFDRESQSAANLDHPSIVPVYAAGEAGGSLYIAMRYVGGGDLRSLLDANGPLSLQQATSIVESVADALDAAHAQGMIHRDVKPANILIDSRSGQEHYYLSDFGIAKIVSAGRTLTSAGQIIGTIDYIAPEQIQGKPVDGRADLYALGCVLYQCLTGVVPYPRDETAALMWAHLQDEASPVTTRRPDLPPQLDYIVAKAMAKQPENRYDTCRELALALRALVASPVGGGDVGKAFPATPIDSSPPPSLVPSGMTSTYTPPTPVPVRAPVTSSPSRRPRWWWFAAGVAILALAGGATAGVMKYFSTRFPNTAEQELLGQIPLALTMKNTCTRNAEAERDTTNVLAAVTCTSDGDGANTISFTKFTSAKGLDTHYQATVAAAGIGQSSGNCLNAGRAEGSYTGESGQTSGRTMCYEQRGSSFVAWTDDRVRTLAQATRVDPDYMKLRDWWAGVVGLPTSAETEALAQAKKQVEDAQKQADEAKKQAEVDQKQQADEAKKQADAAQKQIDDVRKQAEDTRKQQADEAKKQADAAQKQLDDVKKQAEDAQRQSQQQAQSQQQSQKNGNQNSGRQGRNSRGKNQDGGSSTGSQDGSNTNPGSQNPQQQQELQRLINEAVKQALQQQGDTSGGKTKGQDLQQQIEDSVRQSIQQQGNATSGQDMQQLINDAIKLAIQQAAQNRQYGR